MLACLKANEEFFKGTNLCFKKKSTLLSLSACIRFVHKYVLWNDHIIDYKSNFVKEKATERLCAKRKKKIEI